MKRLPRDPLRFDSLGAYSEFGRQEKVSLYDQAATDGFVTHTRASIERSLENDTVLHGLRTESMFESLVLSLGAAEILKQEDAGDIYASDETLKVPDFRLILPGGLQMLIEVKTSSNQRT